MASLSSGWEVVGQAKFLLGHSRSHESIRHSILTEAKLGIAQEERRLQQTENLDFPAKEAPDVFYTEADSNMIKLQKPEKERKPEVKIGIGYLGKENLSIFPIAYGNPSPEEKRSRKGLRTYFFPTGLMLP